MTRDSKRPAVEVARLRQGRRIWTFHGAAADVATVLLWHGSGGCESDVLAPLAATVAANGATVHVPDWDPDSADGGRADLLASLDAVVDGAAPLVLVGWSLGAAAAAGVAVALPEVPLRAVVGLAGAFAAREPITGARPIEHLGSWHPEVPCRLVHGADDEVVPIEQSRMFDAALREAGIRESLTEVRGRHASVVLSAYDARIRRCLPSTDPEVRHAGAASVRAILAATGMQP